MLKHPENNFSNLNFFFLPNEKNFEKRKSFKDTVKNTCMICQSMH